MSVMMCDVCFLWVPLWNGELGRWLGITMLVALLGQATKLKDDIPTVYFQCRNELLPDTKAKLRAKSSFYGGAASNYERSRFDRRLCSGGKRTML